MVMHAALCLLADRPTSARLLQLDFRADTRPGQSAFFAHCAGILQDLVPMKLIFIYGLPGVGKLTVAKELTKLTGYRLFHVHLLADMLESVFGFDSEGSMNCFMPSGRWSFDARPKRTLPV